MGPALQKDYPEVESMARVDVEGGGTLVYGDKKLYQGNILFDPAWNIILISQICAEKMSRLDTCVPETRRKIFQNGFPYIRHR